MHEPLHQLALEHKLAPAQTRALWRLSGLHQPPPGVHRWLRTGLMLAAALLLGAGLIFWVAANWSAQSRMFRLHLLQAAVAVPMLAALVLPASRQALRMALTLLGTLALGGILAYIGITYQTGADAWELFATWAALAIVWVAAQRSDWLWALWLLIVGAAIGSWSGQALFNPLVNLLGWRSTHNLVTSLLWLAVFVWPLLLAGLGGVRDGHMRPARPVISMRLAAVLAIGAWGTQALLFLFWRKADYAGFAMNAALVLLAGWVGWRSTWRDLVVLGLALLAINVLGFGLLGRMLFLEARLDSGGLLLFSACAAVSVGLSARWLYQQQRQQQEVRDAH